MAKRAVLMALLVASAVALRADIGPAPAPEQGPVLLKPEAAAAPAAFEPTAAVVEATTSTFTGVLPSGQSLPQVWAPLALRAPDMTQHVQYIH